MMTNGFSSALLSLREQVSAGPADRRFWIMPAMDREGPSYPIKTAASVFFARSQTWLRSMEYIDAEKYPHGRLVLDGRPIEFIRDNRGARLFFLHDIEPMAFSLHEFGVLDENRRDQAIEIVLFIALQHNILGIY